jgi:hypothetical protein
MVVLRLDATQRKPISQGDCADHGKPFGDNLVKTRCHRTSGPTQR